jgi:hypothetical protein
MHTHKQREKEKERGRERGGKTNMTLTYFNKTYNYSILIKSQTHKVKARVREWQKERDTRKA